MTKFFKAHPKLQENSTRKVLVVGNAVVKAQLFALLTSDKAANVIQHSDQVYTLINTALDEGSSTQEITDIANSNKASYILAAVEKTENNKWVAESIEDLGDFGCAVIDSGYIRNLNDLTLVLNGFSLQETPEMSSILPCYASQL